MTAKALTAADALVRNRIEAIYASELKNAYAAAGRPLSDDTIAIVAASLAAAIPADPDEIRPMFREARSRADIPTQRLLIDSLAAIRERRAQRSAIPGPGPGDMSVKEWHALTGDDAYERLRCGEILSEEYLADRDRRLRGMGFI